MDDFGRGRSQYARGLIEASVDPLVTIGPDGRIMDVNTASENITGMPRDQLIGVSFAACFTEPDRAKAAYQRTFSEGRVTDYPLNVLHQSGRITQVMCNATVYRDDAGEVAGVFASLRDMTGLKEVEDQLRSSVAYSRGLIEASLDPLVTISTDGKIMDVNDATEVVTGRARDDLIGSDFSEYFTDPDEARAGYRQVFSRGQVTDYPLAIRHVSGRVTEVLYNATVYHGEDGRIAGVFAAARDISGLRESQLELERTNREMVTLGQMTDLLQSCQSAEEALPIITVTLTTLFPGSSGAGFLIDDSETSCNPVTRWGSSADVARAFEPDDCWALRRGHLHTCGLQEDINPRCAHVHHTRAYVCAPLLAQGKALGVLYLEFAPEPAQADRVERRLHLVQTATDSISLALANLQLRDSLRALAIRDPLTGLFNRRFMEETLEREVSRAGREEYSLAVAMFDIDHFKEYNDAHGHLAGDLVLQHLGNHLIRFRRGVDVACRYGGEEFVLILPDIQSGDAEARLEQLRRTAQAVTRDATGAALPPVTCSVGMAMYPGDGMTPRDLIDAADRALYRAKEEGRDRLVVAGAATTPGRG